MPAPLHFLHKVNYAIIYIQITFEPTCRLRYFSISPNTPLTYVGVRALHVSIFLRRSGVAVCGWTVTVKSSMRIEGARWEGGGGGPTCGGRGEPGNRRATSSFTSSRPRGRPSAPPNNRQGEGDATADGTSRSWVAPPSHQGGCLRQGATLRATGEAIRVGDPRLKAVRESHLQAAGEAVRVGEPHLQVVEERRATRGGGGGEPSARRPQEQ
jgi:hypothetical protein